MTPTRPLLRYHGGKARLAEWITSQFPAHQIYVEPFGGAASVLLRKSRCYAEIYNDLDGEIVHLFRIVRDYGEEIQRAAELTPFSRDDFELSYEATADPIERARRTMVRSFMGFGGNLTRPNRDGTPQRTGWRSHTKTGRHSTPATDWMNYPAALTAIICRMRGVFIENREAKEVMACHDSPQTLHYVDPPYPHSTRGYDAGGTHRGYRFEMSDDQHRELATFLHTLKGAVVVSGYACELYDTELFPGWQRIEKHALADGARKRVEVLWMRNVESDLFSNLAAEPASLLS